ncbi:HNH endonuclease signature motif containing protein [Streptomyces sp. NPDC097610]|uniref:HNH endonuclease n=1 Tax=Streptomyces sp. NPDC097610 TaxID=3157227 RepID=UPI00333404B9
MPQRVDEWINVRNAGTSAGELLRDMALARGGTSPVEAVPGQAECRAGWERQDFDEKYGQDLVANNGECMYCGDRPQTMDHVTPFADGGADELTNLVPVCHDCNRRKHDCNRRKRDKIPPVWLIGMDLTIRRSGNGTPQGRSGRDGSSMSLREMYLSVHEEVLGLLDDLDTGATEIADPTRREWFETRYRL